MRRRSHRVQRARHRERGAGTSGAQFVSAISQLQMLTRQWVQRTAGYDAVLSPTLAAPPVPVGGVSFHHCRTMHWSGPNTSGHVRRAYVNAWQTPPVRRASRAYSRIRVVMSSMLLREPKPRYNRVSPARLR